MVCNRAQKYHFATGTSVHRTARCINQRTYCRRAYRTTHRSLCPSHCVKSLALVMSVFMLLVSSMIFPVTSAQAEDTGSVTYEHNLLTIKGPRVSRNTILAAIDAIPDDQYFGVLIDGDVEITNCIVRDASVADGSFLSKRDHITSYQCIGNFYLSGDSACIGRPCLNARCLFQDLGSQDHPVTQLDARGLHAVNVSLWNNMFSNSSSSFHSLNWVGITGEVPEDWDDALYLETVGAFSFSNINQIIMSPSSVSGLRLAQMENLDVEYIDRFENARLFINGVEDSSYSFDNDLMFVKLKTIILDDESLATDNTPYNFVIPNADVSVGFYAAGGAWISNDGSCEYVQQQTEKSLQGIKPTLPEPPTREGYTFLGWASDATADAPSVTQDTIPEFGICNCAYYAVWQKDEPVPPTPPDPEPTPDPAPAPEPSSDADLLPVTGETAMGSLALFATAFSGAALFAVFSFLKRS